ncbi:MAG TPA: LamG domain-containing protein, partial [Flavobacteriales bacterium]|nr:LamG domain-containing protein [Flavobacteriales bacterium]
MIGLLAILAQSVSAQTTLISPTGDGGFQNGTTFAANGWSVDNGTVANQWFLGTVPSFATRSAYISNNGGVSNAYTNSSASVSHFWRDVTFPAGETNVTLSFDWEVVGETGFWDAVMVHVAPTTYTPAATTTSLGTSTLAAPAVNITSVWSTGSVVGVQNRTVTIPANLIGNCAGPATVRLIFTWKNDGSGGSAPVAIDNISLTSAAPTSAITAAGGTFTINNTLPTGGSNFATFTAAVNALNAGGLCGFTAPVVFNVTAGQTFNENVPAITVSGTSVNTITFQKNGAGANPVITPSGSAGANDAGITIAGGDYITFNGIDINSLLNAAVEYGYLVRNVSATDGAQFNVIQNCTITLNRSNTTSRGIMQTATTTGGGFSATAASGTNSNNIYRNFNIRNVYGGVFLNGTSTTWPDVNVQVTTTACGTYNSIGDPGVPNDIGNVTSTTTYGIQASNQSDVVIRNNRISNVTTSSAQVDGINLITFSGTCDVSSNIVNNIRQNGTGSTSLASGIRATHNTTGSHTLRMYNNVVSGITSGYTTATSTRLIRGIYLVSTTGTTTYDIWHNNVSITGTAVAGSSACFETTTTSTAATLVIRNNVFANYTTNLNTTGRHYGVVHTSSATVLGAGASVASNNAIHIPNDVGVTGFTALTATTTRNTAADWGGAVVQAAGNINADPIYVNVETNLTPQSPSLNGTGFSQAPAYLTIDANCAARGNDIGAYEFSPPSCFPPTGSVVYVQDCGNGQFYLDVTVTNLSGGPGVNVVSNYPGNPGADFGVGLGTYQIGPFPSNTNVVVTLERVGDPTCDVSIGTYTYDCAINGQNALHFDGVNDRVSIPNSATTNITGNQLTLEAWIYPTAWRTSSFEGSIINKEAPGTAGYMLRCGNNGQLSFNFGTGTAWVEVQSATGALTLNQWQHVAATYDGANLRIYRNGVQIGSLASTATIGAAAAIPLQIGNWSQNDSRGFIGRIDEVRVWNVARSQADLTTFQSLELCGIESGLAAYYRFNQGTAGGNNAAVTTLTDITANANTGTLTGMALTGPTSNWVIGKTDLTPCLSCSGTPTAGTITGTTSACTGVSNTLTATGASLGLGITYQWKYRANGSSDPYTNLGTALTQNTNSLPFGVWEVVFDVTCSDGPTTSSSAPVVFTAYQVPTASASFTGPVCVGQALNLTGTTDIGTTFAWTGPSGFTSTAQNPSIGTTTFGSAGTYSFVATSAAPESCASAPGTVAVTIEVTPTVTVTPATIDICPGGSTTLTALGNATTPLEGVLSAIVGQSSTILATIPTPSGFTDGNTGTNIGDGCLDMYDGGNQINTNLAAGIAYTNGVVTNSASFGTGGRYFTRVIGSNVCGASPTMFVWAADINGLTSVSISGNNGADGGGSQNTTTFNVTANGITYTVLLKRVFGAGDPSINQMFLIPQPNSATQTIGASTDDSQHNILNLAGVSRFYYLLYAGASGALIDDAAATGIAQAFINA